MSYVAAARPASSLLAAHASERFDCPWAAGSSNRLKCGMKSPSETRPVARLVLILAAVGIGLLSVSCGGHVPLTEEELEQAQERLFRAGPEEVVAAALEVYEEMDDPSDMIVARTSDTSVLAERTATVYVLISASVVHYGFRFDALPVSGGGTRAYLAITRQEELLLSRLGRRPVRAREPYDIFWDRMARKLGEGGGEHECPEDNGLAEDLRGNYNSVCLFAERRD